MADCQVWDYDVGWTGAIHDSVLFSSSTLGQRCYANKLGRYCLLGDCAYPARVFLRPPFKGEREVTIACIVHGGAMQVLRTYLKDVCGMSHGVWTYTGVGQADAHDLIDH